jgi:uncharacterized protein (TIGR00369 family)
MAHAAPAGAAHPVLCRAPPAREETRMHDLSALQQLLDPLFPGLMGLQLRSLADDRVLAELPVRPELCTTGGVLHGGAIMAFADTLGAVGAVLNLPAGASTTTLESKTNFFAACKSGTIRAEATPLHRGKRTHVWQTRITDEAGKLLSLTTQTQMIL